ncbi:phage holin family protein [Angustibacter luteus]|uniref:Phage holin family protein n=1 Tax=Angustibacter luteus TaxID=658456 RepID=A0ABW1JHP3_9ACTN
MTATPTAEGTVPVDGTATSERPSIGELLGDVSRDLSELVRQELALAKAEARESATKAGKGAGMFAGAATAGHFALLFLSVAAWWAIGNGTGRGWSALIVMAIWAVIAAVLALLGKKELTSIRGLDRTAETVKKIPPAVKGHEEQNR